MYSPHWFAQGFVPEGLINSLFSGIRHRSYAVLEKKSVCNKKRQSLSPIRIMFCFSLSGDVLFYNALHVESVVRQKSLAPYRPARGEKFELQVYILLILTSIR